MQKLDLLLINPSNRADAYQQLGATLTAIEPPVWAGLMATFARRHGLSVAIIDADAEELTPAQTAARIVAHQAILTAVVVYGHHPSASTQVMPAASAVCELAKQYDPALQLTMVGGHVAALPERTLREEQVDFVCAGEGLHTLVELTQALRSGPAPDLSRVRGLWYRDGEMLRSTPVPPLVRDLDIEMPGGAWDLLPMDRYRAHNWHCLDGLQRQPYAAIYTTLGCPYHCSFCCIQSPFKEGELSLGMKESINSYRFWSPDAVIAQIDTLVNQYGIRNIKIADEMFVLNPRHVIGICDRIIERGYHLNIWAYARVDTVKDSMLAKLKQAGFNWLALGIESANERVRGEVQKGFEKRFIYETIAKVREAGINVIGNYIFGLPEDDFATMQETLDMALDLNCEFANFYCAMAYPGSDLYERALREGWALPATWGGYAQHAVDALPLPTKYLSGGEVLRFRDQAFLHYYTNLSYLAMVEQRFGSETRQHPEAMIAHKLERIYAASETVETVVKEKLCLKSAS